MGLRWQGEEERQRGVLLAVLGRGERQRRGATGRWGRRRASGRRASRGGTLTGGVAMSVGDVGARCAGARAERKGREKRAARAGPSGADGLKARRDGWAACGRKSWAGFALLFFFSLFKLNSNYLNSRGFEFKPYNTQTSKTMHQHECTNILNLQ